MDDIKEMIKWIMERFINKYGLNIKDLINKEEVKNFIIIGLPYSEFEKEYSIDRNKIIQENKEISLEKLFLLFLKEVNNDKDVDEYFYFSHYILVQKILNQEFCDPFYM